MNKESLNLINSLNESFEKGLKNNKGKKLNEAPMSDLDSQFDSRNSFYKKAKVDTGDSGNENKLYSYGTLVAEMKDGKPVVYGTYSQTTLRHIKEWLKQNGFEATNAKQIMNDYGVKNESSLNEIAEITITKDIDTEEEAQKLVDERGIFNKGQEVIVTDWNGKKYKIIKSTAGFNEKNESSLNEAEDLSVEEAWDRLLDMGISEETLRIITSINGYSLETLLDVLYAAYGYRSFDQLDYEDDLDESCKNK